MKFLHYIYLSLLLLTCTAGGVSAQLVVQQQTANDLVTNVLLGGGVQVSNITFSGSTAALGFFNGASTNIGLASGVLMTTGNLQSAVGPNNSPSLSFNNGAGAPPGPIYNALASILPGGVSSMENASVLSFNFIPQGNKIKFRYVFGSEEYPEYVGSQFNDVFGFFLSGPNPAGGNYTLNNLARVPGSGDPVSINTLNNGSTNTGPCTNCSYYINNTGGATIQFDGFTKVLTAEADVVPCSTYTIVLAITDVGDAIYESGVFLEAKSFQTNVLNVIPIINSPVAGASNEIFEGCGTATFRFTREGDLSSPLTISYGVSGTASPADYTPPFSGTVTFAAGQGQVDVTFNAVSDGVTEPAETVTVTIIDTSPCPTTQPPTATVIIRDYEPLALTAPPDVFVNCNNEQVTLNATITGGANNVIIWTPGNIGGNPAVVFPTVTTTYTVSVTEQCANTTLTDQVTVHVPQYDPLTLVAINDTGICGGEGITLWATASGGIGGRQILWSTGATSDSIFVNPTESTTYKVTVTDSCGNVLSKEINIDVVSPTAQFTYAYVDNPTLQFFDQSTDDVIGWTWHFGDGLSDSLTDPLHHYADTGLYIVTLIVENQFGCKDSIQKPVRAYPPTKFYIPNTFTPDGDNINPFFNGKGEGYIAESILIFNRWGEKIYESEELYGRGWDGKYQGKDSPMGTYVYKIEILSPIGEKYRYIGHVNLLR